METIVDAARTIAGAEPYPKRHFVLPGDETAPDTNSPAYALMVLEALRRDVAHATLVLRQTRGVRGRLRAWRTLRRLEVEMRRFTISASGLSWQQWLSQRLGDNIGSQRP